jgi:hypothetical protein
MAVRHLSATFAALSTSLLTVELYCYCFRGKPFVKVWLFIVMMLPSYYYSYFHASPVYSAGDFAQFLVAAFLAVSRLW